MLEIYGFTGSTYTRTACLACVEKAVPYTLRPLEFGQSAHLALHPFARMPAMIHGDIHLFEATAIASYVDAIGRGPSLEPAGIEGRSVMLQWMSAAIDYFYDAFVRSVLGAQPGELPEMGVPRDRCAAILGEALARSPYLAGDHVSLADLMVAPMVAFYTAVEGADVSMIGQRKPLKDWLNRMTTRESFKAVPA